MFGVDAEPRVVSGWKRDYGVERFVAVSGDAHELAARRSTAARRASHVLTVRSVEAKFLWARLSVVRVPSQVPRTLRRTSHGGWMLWSLTLELSGGAVGRLNDWLDGSTLRRRMPAR